MARRRALLFRRTLAVGEVIAQRGAAILPPVDPAFLEFWDQEVDEVLIVVRRVIRRRDLKAVPTALFQQEDHGIGDLARRPDQGVSIAARQVGLGDLAKGRGGILLLIHLKEASGAAHFEIRNGLVEIERGAVHIKMHRHLRE